MHTSFADTEDPARLAQLHERIYQLEDEIAQLKRTLPPSALARAKELMATTPVMRDMLRFEANHDAEVQTFSQAGLKPELLAALRDIGFIKPTPLQSTALVPLIQGKTMLIQSPAGGGRTISYALAALQAINPTSEHLQVLILAASKERATQIVHDLRALSGGIFKRGTAGQIYSALSGTKTDLDRSALSARPKCVVGTPGRIFHLLDRAHLRTSHLRLLIADEADDLLSTFRQLVVEIMRFLPTPAPSADEGMQTVWAADSFSSTSLLSNAVRFAPLPTCVAVRCSDGVWRVLPAHSGTDDTESKAKL